MPFRVVVEGKYHHYYPTGKDAQEYIDICHRDEDPKPVIEEFVDGEWRASVMSDSGTPRAS